MDPATLLMYAQLMGAATEQSIQRPDSWEEVNRHHDRLTGFDAVTYRNTTTGEIVMAIDGATTLQDVVTSGIRRLGGGNYGSRISDYAATQNPNTIIGWSQGGGIASWLGGQIPNAQTVTFNSGRIADSQNNPGTNQTNVWVDGDRWGDPVDGAYGNPLPGQNVELPHNNAPLRQRHGLAAITERLMAR